MVYLAEVNEVFNFRLMEYNFFEAGEGKSMLDTHFARVSHRIVRWVRLGHDLETGEQLADLIKVSTDVGVVYRKLFILALQGFLILSLNFNTFIIVIHLSSFQCLWSYIL